MKAEQKELYNFTKDHFEKELKDISPTCVSPLICAKKLIKKSIEQYTNNYGSKNDEIFSNEDFLEVSKKLYNEIIEGTL